VFQNSAGLTKYNSCERYKSPLHATPRNSRKNSSTAIFAIQLAKELAPQPEELQLSISDFSKSIAGAYEDFKGPANSSCLPTMGQKHGDKYQDKSKTEELLLNLE
jgi:hypothetical protein